MSAGRLFHNRAPAVANVRSPTVAVITDGSVMTADVAWMACPTTVGGLQPDRMVLCHSVTDTRPSPACTGYARGLSTSGNWRVCQWYGPSVAGQRWNVQQH